MSRTPPGPEFPPADERLALYLDGLLEGGELAEFERMLAEDASLRAAVDLDRRMMRSLRETLAPPAAFSAPASATAPRSGSFRSRIVLGIAAAIVLLACGAALWWQHMTTSRLPVLVMKEPAEVYKSELAAGFTPDWVCGDDREMLEFTRNRFGAGLLFTPSAAVSLVGWGYATDSLSFSTSSLLVNAGEDRIVLLVDRASRDRKVEDPALSDPSLHLFRREVGPYVLYEITPRETPSVLDLAYVPPNDLQLQPGEPGPGPSGSGTN